MATAPGPQRLPARILAGLMFLVLAIGSIHVGQQYATDPAGEGSVYAVDYAWPLVMLVVWLLGSGSLLIAQRRRYLARWLLACLLAWLGLYILGMILEIVLPTTIVIVGLLFAIDAVVIYFGWQFLLRI